MSLKTVLLAGSALLALGISPAYAQSEVKIGFITTLTGGNANIGQDMRDAVELALDHMGRKMAGKPVKVIYEDDDQKPEVGKQKAEKLVQSDKVDFVSGFIWSNVLLASAKPITDAKVFLVNANAGATQFVGAQCNPYFFSTSWGNDQMPAAMGELMNQKGVARAYAITGNYAAGRDMVKGWQDAFKGQVVGTDLTKWPDQLDFSAEISKIRNSNAQGVFFFFPGAHGIQFITQYTQAGLKDKIPLYSVFAIDQLSMPLLKDNAVGVIQTGPWTADLPYAANQKFVADFKKKFNKVPTFYAAQTYDAINLIASGVAGAKGDLKDKEAIRAAMKKGNIQSVRGPFKLGPNQVPVLDIYQQVVEKAADGDYQQLTVSTVLKDSVSSAASACKMQ